MSRAIQLGTPFYITIEGEAKLGGFWNLDLVNITVVARGSGVSELLLEVRWPMNRFFSRLRRPLRNERGEITFFACFFVVGVVMLISFLLLYASVRITCINIRNGAKMELNNLSATIYADTYRSQRETNFEEYLRTLYSSNDYTEMLEATVAGGLAEKIPLSTEDYEVSDISLEFNVVGDRVEYIFYCDVEFYVRMFGHSYPTITQRVELTGYHNTKF